MKTDSFVFYRSFYEAIKELPDSDRLAMYDAICEYALEHENTAGTPVSRGMMALIIPQLEANFKRRVNGMQGGRPKSDTKAKPNNNPAETKAEPNVNVNVNDNVNGNVNVNDNRRFIPPTLEEVQEYCRQRNSSVNPKTFYEYFQTGGWKDSKGNKVKNWKQKLITWEHKDANTNVFKEDKLPTYSTDKNTSMDDDEARELLALMGRA